MVADREGARPLSQNGYKIKLAKAVLKTLLVRLMQTSGASKSRAPLSRK
jgi:hypothetical protein